MSPCGETMTTMPAYRTTPFIDPVPRCPGWHDAQCRIAWHPRDGEPVVVVGAYLDAHSPAGPVSLGCGIETAAEAVGMLDWLEEAPGEELTALCDLVSAQLAEQPWAEVICPLGRLRVELVPARPE